MPVPSSYNDVTTSREIRDYLGLVWYDRTFYVPKSWYEQGHRVWLRFGSVHYAAQVVRCGFSLQFVDWLATRTRVG